ncbi:armadillo-type protein [Mycena amicta]|nr:armadillo-type protein [Mycena amicta]
MDRLYGMGLLQVYLCVRVFRLEFKSRSSSSQIFPVVPEGLVVAQIIGHLDHVRRGFLFFYGASTRLRRVLESIQAGLFFTATYQVLIKGFGDFEELPLVPWSAIVQLEALYISTCVAQLTPAGPVVSAGHGPTLPRGVGRRDGRDWPHRSQSHVRTMNSAQLKLFTELGKTSGATNAQAALAFACDILITVGIWWRLKSNKTSVQSTNRLLNFLVMTAINRGVLTMLTALLNIILFLTKPGTFDFMSVILISGKLLKLKSLAVYMNSMLAMLNTRQHARQLAGIGSVIDMDDRRPEHISMPTMHVTVETHQTTVEDEMMFNATFSWDFDIKLEISKLCSYQTRPGERSDRPSPQYRDRFTGESRYGSTIADQHSLCAGSRLPRDETRQQALASSRTNSVASWWSDSRTPGATFSLHAAAKPLMKLLYHRQAREYIKLHREDALDEHSVTVLKSYLEYPYISAETRVIVLEELIRRAGKEACAQDAVVMVNAIEANGHLFRHLVEQSRDPKVVKLTCDLVRHLAKQDKTSTRICIMELAPMLAQISSFKPHPTSAPSCTTGKLEEQSSSRLSAASLVSIAQRSSFASSSRSEFEPDPELYKGLVELISSSDPATCVRGWFGLSYISETLAGAQAVLLAGALRYAGEHLLAVHIEDSDQGPMLAQWVCLVLANISRYRSTLAAVLAKPDIIKRIVELIGNRNTSVRRSAMLAVHNITLYHEGAQSMLAAGCLDRLDIQLLRREEDVRVLYWAARVLANFARHCIGEKEGLFLKVSAINQSVWS